jgi:hypothetical protein
MFGTKKLLFKTDLDTDNKKTKQVDRPGSFDSEVVLAKPSTNKSE